MDKVVNQIMSVIQSAAKELQSGKPGNAVKQLAAILQDEQGSQRLNQIAESSKEARQIIEAVQELMQSSNPMTALKCGGKMKKKKVVKASKGCKCETYKKLMREGGVLTEVEVDCNGNIIK
jgi:thiamine pyrophosphate-dependent acetolactate synthase large subunit-like protein